MFIDTWGKLAPPARRGETTYQRDYRMGGALKALADDRPGTSVWINHHTRKETAEDFVDSASGTHGIAGSVDTVMVLARARGEQHGTLRITGRDLDEDIRASLLSHNWRLNGGSLTEAEAAAQADKDRDELGPRSLAVMEKVEQQGQITTAEASAALGTGSGDASRVLSRLVATDRLVRVKRGVYGVSGVSGASVDVSYVPLGVCGLCGVSGQCEHSNGSRHTAGHESAAIDWAAIYAQADFGRI